MDSLTPTLDQYANAPNATPQPSASEAPMTDEPVNVVNPMGELVSVPKSQLQSMDLLNQGYSMPTEEALQKAQDQKDYGGLGGQINSAIHQGMTAATFGAFPLAERAGAFLSGQEYSPESIQKEVEANPIAGGMGTGTALTFGGVGTALEKGATALGEMAAPYIAPLAEKAAPYVPQFVAKIGSAAAKAAVENTLFQSMDEAGKSLAGDPNEHVDTALSNIKASALLGGALGAGFGVVPELWTATLGRKTAQTLQAIANHTGGIEGQTSDAINQAIDASQLDVPPEMRAALSNVPKAQDAFKDLRQSPTPSGVELAKTANHFRNDISEGIATTLGKTPTEVEGFTDLSPSKEGQAIASQIADEFESKVAPLAKTFEDLKAKKANVPLLQDQTISDPTNPYVNKTIPGTSSQIADQLGQLAQTNKWASDSDAMKMLNQTMKRLPEQETIGDLGQLATRIQDENYNPLNPAHNRDTQQVVQVLRNAESDVTMKMLGDEAPELVAEHQAAREAWHQVSDLKDDLQAKLNLKGGNQNSNNAFIKNIRSYAEEDPEKFLKKITNPDDAYLTKTLREKFPETAQAVRDYQIKNLLGKAASNAKGEQTLNPTTFFNQLDRLSPDLRNSLFSAETQQALEAHRTLWNTLNELDKDRNFSNTAPALMRYLKNIPGSALGLITAATGHNPIVGAILGSLTNSIGHRAPDAIKLAYLKFLGASAPIDSGAFKTMADFIQSARKGDQALSKGVEGILQSGRLVIPQIEQKDKDRLDKTLTKLQEKPEALWNVGGKLGYYMPEHQTVLAQRASTISQYLNAQRPSVVKMSPLDSDLKPTKAAQAEYDRTLEIAENPLSVLPKIKEGTIQAKDLIDLKTMYPGLYSKITSKISESMLDHLSKDGAIPYSTRMGLSLFLGQPLDSTMTPQSILSTQATFQPSQPMAPQKGPKAHKAPINSLKKIASMDETPLQTRITSHSS